MIHIMCSDTKHPVYGLLDKWCSENGYLLISDKAQATGGDVLFLVSCTQFIDKPIRDLYDNVWVIHESDLPKGRGWSPLAWQILEGKNVIVVSILEAADKIDAGRVLQKGSLTLDGSELSGEIQEKLLEVKKSLIQYALNNCYEEPELQEGDASYYKRRTPQDSRIDPELPLSSQFDLLRICEPRFPAYFELRGHKYELTIRKI